MKISALTKTKKALKMPEMMRYPTCRVQSKGEERAVLPGLAGAHAGRPTLSLLLPSEMRRRRREASYSARRKMTRPGKEAGRQVIWAGRGPNEPNSRGGERKKRKKREVRG